MEAASLSHTRGALSPWTLLHLPRARDTLQLKMATMTVTVAVWGGIINELNIYHVNFVLSRKRYQENMTATLMVWRG